MLSQAQGPDPVITSVEPKAAPNGAVIGITFQYPYLVNDMRRFQVEIGGRRAEIVQSEGSIIFAVVPNFLRASSPGDNPAPALIRLVFNGRIVDEFNEFRVLPPASKRPNSIAAMEWTSGIETAAHIRFDTRYGSCHLDRVSSV